jgi:hypothetical protein
MGSFGLADIFLPWLGARISPLFMGAVRIRRLTAGFFDSASGSAAGAGASSGWASSTTLDLPESAGPCAKAGVANSAATASAQKQGIVARVMSETPRSS